MEKKLNAKLRNYIKDFKSNTNNYVLEKLKANNIDSVVIQDIMNYIYSYENNITNNQYNVHSIHIDEFIFID